MYESQAAAGCATGPVRGNFSQLAAEPSSECRQAYDELHASQAALYELLILLRNRLQPVLRDREETKPANGPTVGRAHYSEVHGQFVAASGRTADAASLVSDLIERLTV